MKSVEMTGRLSLCLVFLALTTLTPAHAACDFAAVKQQIDNVIEKDAQKAAKFRSEVADGSDSLVVVEKMVSDEMRDKLDICRFEAGEYLTKRGFPPFH